MYDQLKNAREYRAPFVAPFVEFCEGCKFWGDRLEENLAGGAKNVVKSCKLSQHYNNELIQKMAEGYECIYYGYKSDVMLPSNARR